MEKCAEIKALWTKIVTVLFLCMWSPCIVDVTSNRPKAPKIYDSQICSTALFTNTSEIQWHKMAITKVEQFLQSGISYHCNERKASVNDAKLSLGDAETFEQIDIEVESKSDLCK